jgi:phospho-N-acetylmuramoyl-pentapeptide-transferase
MMYWLYELREWLIAHQWISDDAALYKILNLFKYHTFRAGGAALTAFALSLMYGDRLIRKLISLKIGQPIRTAEEVHKLHELHGKKAGTPTMGGILILSAIVLSTLLWAKWDNIMVWTVLFTTIGLGALGFRDDYLKISKKNSKGVSARTKLVWQTSVAIVAGLLFAYAVPGENGITLRALYIPFVKDAVITDMHLFAVALFAIIIVGSSNAVNLTDGLDGLATGCSITTSLAYAAFGYVCGNAKYSDYLGVAHNSHGGCLPRLPLVQCAPGQNVHGRHRLPGAWRLHRRAGYWLQAGDRPRPCRRRLRHGGHERHPAGLELQEARQAHLPHGSDPPSF